MSFPVIEAELFFESNNALGEGILWDERKNLLHWVDIDESSIHTLDPETKDYSVVSFPESQYLTAIALRESEPGFIGTLSHSIVLFPAPSTPTTPPTKTTSKSVHTLSTPLPKGELEKVTRFNDGACDSNGRFFAGSMTKPSLKDGKYRGEVWRIDPDGKERRVMDSVGTSNGLGWSPDNKLMYYIDSVETHISVFDYDLSTGIPTNKRIFAPSPPSLPNSHETTGVFDGLTMDGVGNLWVARWKDQRIIGYNSRGEIIGMIKVPGCKSPTIPCFGGKDLDIMYIASAHSRLASEGDIQSQFPNSGDIFKVDLSFGSAARLALGLGDDWKGKGRYRFKG